MVKPIGIAALLLMTGVSPAAAQATQMDADSKEIQSYRLTMVGLKKMGVAMRSIFEEMKRDPRVQEISRLEADIKALEDKEEPTEADDARLETLRAKHEQLEDSLGGGMSFGNEKTLSGMEAKIKQSPVMMRGLQAANLSPREYAKLSMSMLTSAMYAGMKKSGMLKELPKEANPENVQFILDNEAELAAMQKEWAAFEKDVK